MNDRRKPKNKNKDPKSHFWIPDSEVDLVEYKPRSIPTPRDINHVEHGTNLAKGIEAIRKSHRQNKTPISDKIIIFKVELEEEDTIDDRGDFEKLFSNNKLRVNSIKKSNVAIVSTSPANLNEFDRKLSQYTQKDGKSHGFFQYIKSISSYASEDKLAQSLKDSAEIQDVQITLIPSLESSDYEKMIEFLSGNILSVKGELLDNIILQNNTPVLRALIPSSGLKVLADQEIVLEIGRTPFFETETEGGGQAEIDFDDVKIEFLHDPRELPIICVLDDGVSLPESMSDCIAGKYISEDLEFAPTCEHGTKVASRAIFGDDIDTQVLNKQLVPKVRIIDAAISDGLTPLDEPTLIKRIRLAVESIKDRAQIFCLALNQQDSLSGDFISNLAFELDSLTKKYTDYGIQFVVPTGNHKLWSYYSSLDDIIDDDASRMAAPSESFYALTVGSVSRDNHPDSISGREELSPFSRIGFGFAGSPKPDVVYPGGNVYIKDNKGFISANCAAYVINNEGKLTQDFGTSFSAPLAAQELALLTEHVPENDILIAKALLLHHAETPHIDSYNSSQDSRELHSKLYGKGLGNYLNSKNSYKSRASYIRKGKLGRLLKQRIRFYMPSTISKYSNSKKPVVKVSVTCICFSPVNQSMGYEYLRAYVDTSLHTINSGNNMETNNPAGKEGRKRWNHIHHFNRIIKSFNPGDWQIWLQLYTKPELTNDEEIDYILIVSIEDLTTNDVDVHGGISIESHSRFEILSEIHVEGESFNNDEE
ncbi:S8 family peptidase [Paenibacillus popilliae]|uniref:Subtilisin-like serine protease n=1 Tax=Paenibacillus popilliae ATCC 14706 TaxID=1212764 RepID=M9LZY8_PAEPP|nr:S8 family peptidase [Paenibacillus popilliae]GAC41984.1 subtilisin-like serine protease [Paenibacillus popilliae ATCC 14706]